MICRDAVTPFALIAAVFGCVSERSDLSATQTDHDWRIDPTPVAVVGQVEGDPEHLFERVRSVHLVNGNRFAVADWGSFTVRIYDLDGHHLRTIGGRGEGPGEFGHLSATWVSPPDTVHVLDLRLRRISSFLLDGTLLGTTSISSEGWATGFVGAFGDGSVVLGWIRGYLDREARGPLTGIQVDTVIYEYFGADGQYVDSIGQEPGMWHCCPDSRRPTPRLPVPDLKIHALSPRSHALVQGDTMFTTDGLEPEVRLRVKSGRVVRTIPLPRHDISAAEAMDAVRDAVAERGAKEALGQLDGMPKVDSIPRIGAMLMDDQGLIWAKRYDPGTDSGLSVLSGC